MERITCEVFRTLECAWRNLGYLLVDLKIEFGKLQSGSLLVADVIDNDSWRLWNDSGIDVSKQSFRDGEALSAVEQKYAAVAELAHRLAVTEEQLLALKEPE